jgi:voltage-gated potassium channel
VPLAQAGERAARGSQRPAYGGSATPLICVDRPARHLVAMSEQEAPQGPKLLMRMLGRRLLTAPRAAIIIGTYTVVITLAGAALARLVDRHDFHSFGAAVWWALQTVTTVGYGDIVPTDTIGRIVGGLLMVSGIAFLAVISASVTAALIEAVRERSEARTAELTPEPTKEIAARLASLEARFDKFEAALRSQRD